MTIVEFLQARITEDEAIAQMSFSLADEESSHWYVDGMQVWARTDSGVTDRVLVVDRTWPHEAAHIARFDPARVLRECATKRRILNYWTFDGALPTGSTTEGPDATMEADADFMVRVLAAVYSDHDDYNQEWTL